MWPTWGNFFTGDFGNSLSQYPTPVMSLIGQALPRTIVLFLTATLVSYYLGFLTGRCWPGGGGSSPSTP